MSGQVTNRIFSKAWSRVAGVIAVAAVAASAAAAGNDTAAQPGATKKPAPIKSKVTGFLTYGEGEAKQQTDQELLGMIKSFDFLLKTEKTKIKRDQMMLGQTSAALALSRNNRIKTAPTEKTRALDKRYSTLARKIAERVAEDPDSSVSERVKAMQYSGIASMNLGETLVAKAKFLEAIKLEPKNEHAPAMALFVAETSFDHGLYAEAIDEYRLFFARDTDAEKVIAIYKTGWCHFNLGELEAAEKNFMRLAGNEKAGAFADDSLKDLAYVFTQHRDEADIVSYTAKELADKPALRLDVLTTTYKTFMAQSGTRRRPILYKEIMALETDPARRIALMIAGLRAQQRRYASLETFNDFQEIREKLKEWEIKPASPAFEKIREPLENEIKSISQNFAETFNGRTLTPDKIPKDEVGKMLIQILDFHAAYFPKSADLVTSYAIWFEICHVLKDLLCTYQVSKGALQNDNLPKLKALAQNELLVALETLQKKDPNYRAELITTLAEIYREMAADPNLTTLKTPAGLAMATRLTVLLNDEKRYPESLAVLEKINALESTPESQFRLLWATNAAGLFEDVVAKPVPTGDSRFAKDSRELIREAHLRLAQSKADANDFAGYESHIKSYLALNPDREKLDLVQRDYLGRLEDRKEFDRVRTTLMALPPARRRSKALRPVLERMLAEDLRTAQFAQARELLGPDDVEGLQSEWFQSRLGLGTPLEKPDFARLSTAKPEVRAYVLSLLALLQEDTATAFFKSIDLAKSPDKSLLIFAYRVKADGQDPEFDAATMRAFGKSPPPEIAALLPANCEIDAAKVEIPKIPNKPGPKTSARLTRIIQESAERTRRLRRRFLKAIEGRPPRVQKRILLAGVALEEKVGGLIISSPVPRGLSARDMTDYRKGLDDLSHEFKTQSEEYQKLIGAIDEKLRDSAEVTKSVAALDPARWRTPDSPVLVYLNPLLEKSNFVAAMILIDRWKASGDINDETYFALRVKILLAKSGSDFMKVFAHDELVAAQQVGLVEQWGKTTP